MMSDLPKSDTLTAALNAYDAGLCVVRVTTDGKKKPLGTWKQYQAQRPTRDQVAEWFAHGHPGMGVICGAVSGDLEMLELEGRFMTENDGAKSFPTACKQAGLELLLKRIANGYHTISPSGGRHFIYRVSGPVDGNTKLARRPSTDEELAENADDLVKTLIETRGEGGFVVLAPSHGPVHPSGRPWTVKAGTFLDIPTITSEEREALFAVCRSFNQAPPVKPAALVTPRRRVGLQAWNGQEIGESWMDAVVDHLAATTDMQTVLEAHSWEYCYTDAHGRRLLRRPGKDQGVSGSINASGRLLPFSTSVPFDAGGRPPSTYDVLDVIAAYEHGGDRAAAARRIADDTGIYEAWRTRHMPVEFVLPPKPARVNPETGEIDDKPDGFDDAFWNARPYLAHIRQAAQARLVSPTAVLGAVLARVAAFTPPSTCLPAYVGSTAPLSLYVALRGSSGAGKSAPMAAAADLLPETPAGCVGPMALGSGEGLVEAYMDNVEEEDAHGKKRKVKRQIHHGALFSLDEGQVLAEIGSRKGATIMPILRTAWSGGDPGQANASIETKRSLRPGTYAVGLISLWQNFAAAALLADSAGGTPQRFVWLDTADPDAPDDTPDWPGSLGWTPPPKYMVAAPLEVDPAIKYEITTARRAELRGLVEVEPLDGHRRLNRFKLAGILAVLDGRCNVRCDDWEIAGQIMTASDGVRDYVLAEARRAAAEAEMASHQRAATREIVVSQTIGRKALESAARSVANKVWRSEGTPLMRRDLTQSIRGSHRKHVTVDDAIAEAERLQWIAAEDDKWTTGKARPA